MRRMVEIGCVVAAIGSLTGGLASPPPEAPGSGHLLVPMDRAQANHLKAYGLTYWVLEEGESAEWLLDYRDGAFLLPDGEEVRREAAMRGVTVEEVSPAGLSRIRTEMSGDATEAVQLDTPPDVAIYTPPNTQPWEDAVTLVFTYAGIDYDTVWDPEVLDGRLEDYDWLHLHHEDFTGQYSKFYRTYAGSAWLREEVERNETVAAEYGFSDVPALKRAVAEEIRGYVERGGFLFAMCTATETLDLALASRGVDIAASYANGSPPHPDASEHMDWSRALAFQGAEVETDERVNAFSDIDSHRVNTPSRRDLGEFILFDFTPGVDPVPAMLTQNHEDVIRDFYGQTTAFQRDRIKPAAVVLAEEGDWVKYIHGQLGEGTWTFYGGHDPEDPEHQIGDEGTDLDLHPDSPGFRLILNNILFPAAEPEPQKT